MPNDIPLPSPDEEIILKRAIIGWPLQLQLRHRIATAVVRGYDAPQGVADYLGVAEDEVAKELPYIHGLLLDRSTNKIWIK